MLLSQLTAPWNENDLKTFYTLSIVPDDDLIVLGELNGWPLDGADPVIHGSKAGLEAVVVEDDGSVVDGGVHAPEEENQLDGLVDGDVEDDELQELEEIYGSEDDPVGDPLGCGCTLFLSFVGHPCGVDECQDRHEELSSVEVRCGPESDQTPEGTEYVGFAERES